MSWASVVRSRGGVGAVGGVFLRGVDRESGAAAGNSGDRRVVEVGTVSPDDHQAIAALLPKTTLQMACGPEQSHVLLNGRDITGELRTPDVTVLASMVSAIPVSYTNLTLPTSDLV